MKFETNFNFRRSSSYPFNIILLMVLTLILVDLSHSTQLSDAVAVDVDPATNGQNDPPQKLVKLIKCPWSFLEDKYIHIPPLIRAPHSPEVTQLLGNSQGSSSGQGGGVYNFSLVDSVPILCESRGWLTSPVSKEGENGLVVHLQIIENKGGGGGIKLNHLMGSKASLGTTKNYFTADGYFKNNLDYFNPDSYCVSNITATSIDIQICPPDCLKEEEEAEDKRQHHHHPCLIKCCPMGMMAFKRSSTSISCIETAEDWQPHFFSSNKTLDEEDIKPVQNYQLNYIYPHFHYGGGRLNTCAKQQKKQYQQIFQEDHQDVDYEEMDIRLLTTGQILMRRSGNDPWARLGHGSIYCIDGLYHLGQTDVMMTDSSAHFTGVIGQVLVHCDQEPVGEEQKTQALSTLYFVALCISALPLLMIVIVYGLIWHMQNIHGWTTGSFCLSMFFSFVFTAVAHATGIFHFVQIPSVTCIALGALAHFFYIASFSWLTVLNFDVWNTIRSRTSPRTRSKGKRRFFAYCSFGFGLPTLIVSIGLIMETQFGVLDSRVIRPQYGLRVCHLDTSAFFPYAIMPAICLYILNMLFALLVLKTMWDIKKGAQKFADSNCSKASRSQAKMFIKLFVLMGASWIFEIVSWLSVRNSHSWFWAFFDMFNILQAFILFWIFVCKPDVRAQLSQKYTFFDKFFKRLDTICCKSSDRQNDDATLSTGASLSKKSKGPDE